MAGMNRLANIQFSDVEIFLVAASQWNIDFCPLELDYFRYLKDFYRIK